MTRQSEKEIKMYNGKVFGVSVSNYGLRNGYLDYHALSKIVGDCVLNNYIFEFAGFENWTLVSGEEESDEGWYDVYQYYIVSEDGARVLEEITNELVYYHEELNMYLWGVTHFGTGWDHVLTDVKLIN